jgi:hypothetical protein
MPGPDTTEYAFYHDSAQSLPGKSLMGVGWRDTICFFSTPCDRELE